MAAMAAHVNEAFQPVFVMHDDNRNSTHITRDEIANIFELLRWLYILPTLAEKFSESLAQLSPARYTSSTEATRRVRPCQQFTCFVDDLLHETLLIAQQRRSGINSVAG